MSYVLLLLLTIGYPSKCNTPQSQKRNFSSQYLEISQDEIREGIIPTINKYYVTIVLIYVVLIILLEKLSLKVIILQYL